MEIKSTVNNQLDDLISMHELNSSIISNEELLSEEKYQKNLSIIKNKNENNTKELKKLNSEIIKGQSPGTMKLTQTKKVIIFGIAWICVLVGILIGNFWTPIVNKIVQHELVISPISRSYSIWKVTPIPMYLKIHLFNWTNPQDVVKNKSKPHFTEMGPYVFREVDYKINHVWNDNGTVTFNQKRVWHFEQNMSNGFLNDTVTNLNPVAVTLGYRFRYKPEFLVILVNYLLQRLNETLTVTKKVGDVLFDGYDDELLELAKVLNISTGIPSDKFGWFYGRNESETYDGFFNMLTGSDNMLDIGVVQEWNYKNKSDYYNGTCSHITGTLGDLLPPLVHNDSIPVFAPDICTTIHLKYNNTMEHEGLPGKRFISTAEMLDNGTNVPSRSCYCEHVECQPSGVLNVSSCKYGAPAFMSLPHFYLADESYINAVDGLKPNKAQHEFSLSMQPDLGTPLEVRARLQLNLLLQPIEHIKIFDKVPRVYMPILWFTQEANLTSSYANQIKIILVLPLLGHVTFYAIAAIGILVFFIGICLIIREGRKSDDIQNLIPKNDDNAVTTED